MSRVSQRLLGECLIRKLYLDLVSGENKVITLDDEADCQQLIRAILDP